MKLENQVCTLEQAKMLKELGVIQKSIFFHRYRIQPEEFWCIEMQGCSPASWATPVNEYSAYTVAELGVMLVNEENGYGFSVSYKHPFFVFYEQGFFGSICSCSYEAEAKAKMLIFLLQNKLVTSEECNKRLSES